jgi:hypothetical protein
MYLEDWPDGYALVRQPRPRRTHRQLPHQQARAGIGTERYREGTGRHALVSVPDPSAVVSWPLRPEAKS